MKTLDKVINETIGIAEDAKELTPMDKGECKLVAVAWAAEVVKSLNLQNVTNSTPKKGTGWYIIVVTLLVAISAGLVGMIFKNIDAAIITVVLCLVALCAGTRFQV